MPIVGAVLAMVGGGILPVLVENRLGYKNLCELLTQAHLRSEKGKCPVRWDELPQFTNGLVALFGSGSGRFERDDADPARTFGVSPKQSFENSRMQNAFASTPQSCAQAFMDR